MVELGLNELTALRQVAAGRSPWDGWDRGVEHADRPAQSEAYGRRQRAIEGLRAKSLLCREGLLTDEARAALKALDRVTEDVRG